MSSFQMMNPAAVRSQNSSGPRCVQRHQYPKEDVTYELQGGSKMVKDGQRCWYIKKLTLSWYVLDMVVDSNLLRCGTFGRLMPKSHQGAPPVPVQPAPLRWGQLAGRARGQPEIFELYTRQDLWISMLNVRTPPETYHGNIPWR